MLKRVTAARINLYNLQFFHSVLHIGSAHRQPPMHAYELEKNSVHDRSYKVIGIVSCRTTRDKVVFIPT